MRLTKLSILAVVLIPLVFGTACDDPPPTGATDITVADVVTDVVADLLEDPGTVKDTQPGDVAGPDTATDTTLPDTASDVADATPDTTTDAPADVADVPEDVADVPPPSFHGQAPSEPTPIPAFTQVADSTGTAVGPADLIGHWTVMWFYPAAGTSG